MTDDQWNRVWIIYESLSATPRGDWASAVHFRTDDEVVASRVLEMLECPDERLGAAAFDPQQGETLDREGTRLGRYLIGAQIGRGGMGLVYAARDLDLNRTVALKFLTVIEAEPEPAIAPLLREAQAASQLNHHNIVTVHEVIREPGSLAIVMEMVEGQTLRSLLTTPLPVRALCNYGLGIAQALTAAHRAGIVHRDIKPENVMIRPDGYVKVLDFGLAASLTSGHSYSTGPALGTWRYMSPEQAQGEPISAASDIFSLGVVFYEAATGTNPFEADSLLATLDRIANDRPQPPSVLRPDLPAQLSSLILCMLEKDPEKRPSAQTVSRDLAPYTVEPDQRVKQPRSIWTRWVFASVAIVVAGALLSGAYVLTRRRPGVVTLRNNRALTAQPGWEKWPAVSADGAWIAFSRADQINGKKQIYVMGSHSGGLLRLDGTDGVLGGVAWSPDARSIAFVQQRGNKAALYRVGREGDAPVKIADLENPTLDSQVDWSPDGINVAVANSVGELGAAASSIYLYNAATGAHRKLTNPPPGAGDASPQFSPDGQQVAFIRLVNPGDSDVYAAPANGGDARRITWDQHFILTQAWTPDCQALIVSSQHRGDARRLWRYDARSPGAGIEIPETLGAMEVAVARKAGLIAWDKHLDDTNIYRVPASGKGEPQKLIASTEQDLDPDYSVDGRIVFRSDRGGSMEIWITEGDGSNPVRVTTFNDPSTGSPRWSPNGRGLAFDSRVMGNAMIFVADCAPEKSCDEPKPVTPPSSTSALPSWSSDGESVYFGSNVSGSWQIWKQSLRGGNPVQITRHGGLAGQESRDGQWLYFSKVDAVPSFWRMPGSRASQPEAPEEMLISSVPYRAAGLWALTSQELFFVDTSRAGGAGAIQAFDIARRSLRTVIEAPAYPIARGISVSADRAWVLYPRFDRSGSNIMVAELP